MSERKPTFDVIWARAATDRPAPLTREQIVGAAIEIADESGIDAVSIRRIAARLKSGATTLYWHVPSKSDLYELMFDAAFAELEFPGPSGDWRTDVRVCALRIHELMNGHPWLVLLGIQPTMGPNIQRYAAFAASVFGPLGLDRSSQIEVFAIVNNYLVGFAHRRTAWEALRQRAGLTDEQWRSRLDEYLADARGTDPLLAADIETRLHLTSQHSFELGLDCMLDGIAARFVTACQRLPGDPRSTQPE